ncbi:MAG TPA: branched-chain amino acid ABC transporter permease [Alphaproteobacteria bacterium]|nr:branched-chain amino acid ABC transporter permease [Alphaproteobacteria bacterium]
MLLFIEQVINGLQLGVMLFLMAAGLTLVFGIMNMVNLAHGSLYMMGAFYCATLAQWTGSFFVAALFALPAAALTGVAVELIALRTLYSRDHLDQVLATFGLILFFNELVRVVWGPVAIFMDIPPLLSGGVEIVPGAPYPVFRLFVIVVGIAVAVFLWWLITRTRLGMLIRAGATNREMIGALGVDIKLLYTLVFALGAALAGLAGLMAGPLYVVEIGMGDAVLIKTFVVIVIGGIGSIRGAFIAALVVGVVDTFGRVLPAQVGLPNALSEMAIYILMAAVLFWRPRGLFAPGS